MTPLTQHQRPEEKVWFPDAVDGLYRRALAGMLTPGLKAGLRKRGIDLDEQLEPAYPAAVWTECLCFSADTLFHGVPRTDGLYRLGQQFSTGFASTLVGKALYSLLKVLGPRRTLPRMGRNFKSVSNYLEVSVVELEHDCFTATFNDVGTIPHFYKGLIDTSGKFLGAPRSSATAFDYDGTALTLYIDIRQKPTTLFPAPGHIPTVKNALLEAR